MSIIADMFDVPLNEIKKPLQDLVEGVLAISGPKVLSADATAVSSNTLTVQSGLSKTIVSGTVYSFKIILWITATLAEGWQLDLNGGTATVSWIKATAKGYDGSSLALIAPITALNTNISPQDGFSGMIEIEGSFVPSGNGTFIPRIAQTNHASGSVTVLKGSFIACTVSDN